jgi:hypothetical protein
MIAIINLLTNIFITGTSIIGCATIVNKLGKFCKIIEENNEDGFKTGFDNFMMETIDDMNKCVESLSTISSNLNNVSFILYDIIVGNKHIKKNKDGKIVLCEKTKLYSGYKDKIEELKSKVKKYEEELNKMKSNKTSTNKKKEKEKDNDSSYDELFEPSDKSCSDNSKNSSEDSNNSSDDEFTLDSSNSND